MLIALSKLISPEFAKKKLSFDLNITSISCVISLVCWMSWIQMPDNFSSFINHTMILNHLPLVLNIIMMSSNGNICHATGPLWRESTGHWWFPLTNASDVEFWCFFFFICARTNSWENTWYTGDLRCHSAHYDVTVIYSLMYWVIIDLDNGSFLVQHQTII